LLSKATEIYSRIEASLSNNPAVELVRGRGALMGVVFKKPQAKKIASILKNNGVLVGTTSDYVIRLAPPLNISQRELSFFIEQFNQAVKNDAL
jgi:acetylornithine/succinyldiaminopimelate/putrescine aminotransferase